VEKRGLKYHRGRVGEALREEIETLVEGELADPRIGLVSVTAVHIADDGRSAQVWVNVEGDDEDADQAWRVWKRRANIFGMNWWSDCI
jgi:ribosome-binding factor A